MPWLRRIVAFLVAIVATTVLGCLASTHFVLLALAELDVAIASATAWAPMATTWRHGASVGGHRRGGFRDRLSRCGAWRTLRTEGAHMGLRCGWCAAAILVALLGMEATLAAMPVAGCSNARGAWPRRASPARSAAACSRS